ncbi:MAG: transcription termination factor NusA [Candidatus Buchananbacteria bacterium RIFCSPHIGHO2_02_FULL_40_13]|uniref:Transcription termination/antitermination protein NusA n=1 Tax=Candidatus Buchananbacteria bacterium RIFCSPLOWO2_01_FULL_39_33 TaxID=1797543 RepID=A0A1G1YK28_9BACT|nr:MAG: transcription termination factor NusA [Candidatus Buchananbacteria bacterium RIFCSPHIGHO2_01_FULL_40_35]OGY50036.1 MAG: transcription termination factor NusA [Candidatus Buchananbacteria bacterium RIFCSPHIGHO2_02_FULL_40_13]OGY52693.1 MAG: transcription termination factor NusA [Candidatus Buchananbacteria bacterium RIFCSPLOWO2_01_FULL_39_33]
MTQSAIQAAIQQICQEKHISEESVLYTIELALAAAFRKDFGNKMQNIITEFDPKTGQVKVFDFKTVVEDLPAEELAELKGQAEKEIKEVEAVRDEKSFITEESLESQEEVRRFNPKTEIQLKDAKLISPKYKVGDEIITPLEVPGDFGRMAAQTAKQVIIQKIREVERQNIFDEFKVLEHQVVNGSIQRKESRNVLVDLGTVTALMPLEEQVSGERYNVGNRLKFYIRSVEQTARGPQIIVSRASAEMVRKIFELEIPEIASGVIEIKAIAREAGNRSKVAIMTNDDGIDPIGSCVGQRGGRIQTIISELNGEKVDIILYDENPVKFITNALSPAKVLSVEIKESGPDQVKEKSAIATVKEDQLSLAIGRGGQNVRLASKLTNWKIDIISASEKIPAEIPTEAVEAEPVAGEIKGAEPKVKARKPRQQRAKKGEPTEEVEVETATEDKTADQ